MKLSRLIESLHNCETSGILSVDISSIEYDSRKVQPGSLFVAMRGVKTDGHKYIKQAIEKGAVAVMVEDDLPLENVAVIRVPNTRKGLARVAATFYDNPANNLKIIGITGTNGKTTTSYMISEILKAHGKKTGIIGTLCIKIGDNTYPTNITTPESLEIQKYLSMMVSEGVEYAVMEVSSHALHFNRVEGIKFQVGIFTNISQDHLDFHGNLENYFEDKKKLFYAIKPPEQKGYAVLNSDDWKTPEIIKILKVPYLTYGIYRLPNIRATKIKMDFSGTSFIAESERWDIPIKIKMAGIFNIYNALAAVGAGLALDVPPAAISKGLSNLSGVRGRFEPVDMGQPFGVVIDYAHTPDGIRQVLSAARDLTQRKLIVVFGCGGDRDRTKRPIMGEYAAEYADIVIITSDNPRTEDPMAIISEIQAGVEKGGKTFYIEPDRKSAIFKAIGMAEPGDMVVIAGKGHENYQIFRDRTIHFDDREVAQEALKEMAGASKFS